MTDAIHLFLKFGANHAHHGPEQPHHRAAALEHLDRGYGDIERYLTGPAAMELSDLKRLSAELLTA